MLARVKQDLALGHTYSATQRLRTLVTIHPDDLELREMLATVYRQTGNQAEAGRWAFLTADISPGELAAFERANPDPWLRLRMLRWSGDASALPTDAARARFTTLATAARRSGPPDSYRGPLSSEQRRRRLIRGSGVPCLFVVLAMIGLGSLAAIGFLRALNWVLG